ncbi:MAG: hypothetical protein COW66_08965 [Flavobacteriaceae bacterium CG18_big_fil_WC_8_21_14_2_50_34_36]|nr:MAG: hypothetical protein COW66_08965 [Flavobacteriaceae bacterium CG18_big_fil_WC_8_21_14_2_50_34_36]
MKIFTTPILVILLMSFVFFSCQKEESEFIDTTPVDTITANSVLATLLQNASQNSGSIDDFIDGTPCSSIQFPYQVIINGQTIIITDATDLAGIANTTSPITIVFPITVVFEDFSTLLVINQQELDALVILCQSLDDSISCLDIVYPITFFVFNSNNEQTGTVVITSDAQLFIFLTTLEDGLFLAIDYPITVILSDGTSVVVTSNNQLQDLIENCVDIIIDDNPLPIELETVLTTDSWFVSFFFDDQDETSDFAGYEFVFHTDGTASVTLDAVSTPGTWSVTSSSEGQLKLILNFGLNFPLDELEEDWKVIEFSNELIRLFDISGGDGSTDYLTFSRTPTTGGGGGSAEAQQLRDILIDGNWFVAQYLDDGIDDETSDFNSFSFNFMESGVVAASNTSGTLNGTWFVTGTDGNLKLVLNFNNVNPLDDLDDDWMVIDFQNNQVRLREDNNSNADLLTFEKL